MTFKSQVTHQPAGFFYPRLRCWGEWKISWIWLTKKALFKSWRITFSDVVTFSWFSPDIDKNRGFLLFTCIFYYVTALEKPPSQSLLFIRQVLVVLQPSSSEPRLLADYPLMACQFPQEFCDLGKLLRKKLSNGMNRWQSETSWPQISVRSWRVA